MSLIMEGDTRKRKMATIQEEEQEDEDVKMEKFFALIRSAKDIRDQLFDEEESSNKRGSHKKAVATATTTTQYYPTDMKFGKSKMYAAKKAVEKKTAPEEVSVLQRYPRKPPSQLKEKAPAEDNDGVSLAAAAPGDSISGGGCSGSGSARICRSVSEETINTGGADHMNNNSYQQGRFFLDLNLSL